jgi:hypothetical protein
MAALVSCVVLGLPLGCGATNGGEQVVLGAADVQSAGTRVFHAPHHIVHEACLQALQDRSLQPATVTDDEIVTQRRPYIYERPRFSHGYTLRLRDVPDGVEVVATPWLFDDGVDISGRPVWDRKEQRSDWNGLFQQIEEGVALRLKIAGRIGQSRGAEEGTKATR